MPRRPGITFETVTPSPPETLPRMDIAAFVGFATRGPIDVPVPVEGLDRFRDVFGPPLDLIRDREDGRTKTAHLHRAVEAFFRNGGRRCWVVRVANPASTASGASAPVRRTSFPLPGLVSAEKGEPVPVRARCYGATFEDLRAGTVLHSRLLPVPSSIDRSEEGRTLSWLPRASDLPEEGALTTGDLLRLTMEDGRIAFAPLVSKLQGGAGTRRALETGAVSFFRKDPPALGESEAVSAEVKPMPDASGASSPSGHADATPFRARVERSTGPVGEPRFLLAAKRDAVGEPADRLEHRVVHVRRTTGTGHRSGWLGLGSPQPGGGGEIAFAVRDALWPVSAPHPTQFPTVKSVERLTFDLLVWKNSELRARADSLGFATTHPRSWTDLPVDEELFDVQDGQAVAPDPGTLRADVFDPRFPLAAPLPNALPADGPGPEVFLPLGMPERPDPGASRGRIPSPEARSRLEKERLSTFTVDAFVDRDLMGERTQVLEQKADDKIHLRQEASSGLHALWPIREVALLSVPDALHRGWTGPERVTPVPASTPSFRSVAVHSGARPPFVRLSWAVEDLSEPGVEVEVQEATEPTFDSPAVRYRGSDDSTERFVREEDPVTLYFRFRVVTGDRPGAWSETRRADVPDPAFAACRGRPDAPRLGLDEDNSLLWTPIGEEGITYQVQIDTTPTFDTPETKAGRGAPIVGSTNEKAEFPRRTLSSGQSLENPPDGSTSIDYPQDVLYHEVETGPTTPPVRYGRVRGVREVDGQTLHGAWSRTVAIVRVVHGGNQVVSRETYDDPGAAPPGGGREGLYEVHRAMLRFGAARGDVVSVLALPEDDEADDARRHSTRLRTPGAVLESEEEKTLSYGALYHPWLLGPEVEGAGVRSTPPDGAACGTIARRTLRDGAWAAPANERVPAVRTVVPPLEKSQQARLADHNVNVFGEEPGGVLTLGASTLARNPDFEPISTRRLLILIRRLTLREGPELVFENNTPLLRRRIAEQFDALLGGLFKRGAFAGATPEEGYRVRTGPSVNPPGQVERGRLVIELRVAPARPMKFLTVRLVQRGNQSPSVVETGAI
jgi:hypothetical protein